MNKAFITIEVLVAMVILFLSIATLSTSTKFFTTVKIKKANYEEYYRTFLNVKDKLLQKPCATQSGEYNNFSYKLTCKTEKNLRNYRPAFDEGDPEGNIGPFVYELNKNILTLSRANISRSIEYYTTSYRHE